MPQLALSYKSSEVDGRTSVTNNQPSWAGEGWSLSPGFVERTYGPCAEDDDPGGVKPPESMGDLCWRSDNATAAYGSSGGALIRDDASGTWRTKSDDGSRIVRFQDDKGILNGDDNGEHWQITSPDGTQYWFGSQLDANSTWTVPVFGDDKNEPCNKATLAESSCVQSYRWLLDKVIDRNGNVIRYFYTKETNKYGMNEKDTGVEYVRGGTLSRIDYGLRDDGTAASGRVLFTVANRCVQNSICDDKNPNNWPDVAWENKCDATPCKHHSPSFWSTQRLASVTTQVLRGGAYDDVDRWDLEHHFPDPGDREKAALWLKSITHTGLVGDGSIEQPKVTFEGTALPNRVDTAADGIAPLYRYRITGIRSESGGLTSITYSSQCTAENKPTKPEENDQWCFPVKWAPKNFAEREDYFHKYVVTKVITSDRLNVQNDTKLSSQEQVVSYEYLGGAAWHRDTSEFTKESKKGYNEFRGFGRVRTRLGTADNLSGRITMSEERFYRGMDGDKLPNGPDGKPRFREAKVVDSENVPYPDSDWLQGFGFESANFAFEAPTRADQPDPPRITKSISKPYVKGPTAARGAFKAYIVRTESQRTFTERDSGERYVTESKTDYDDYGLPIESDDLGDVRTAADDKCTRTVYAPNTGKWIMNLPGTVETVSVNCDATPVFPKDAISASRNTYDDNGNVKTVEVAKERPAADPDYVLTSTTDYDKYGRAKKVTDALGRATTTVFTPESGGPLTQTTVTTPEPRVKAGGLVTTTTIEPAWGMPTTVVDPNSRVTTMVYDALGRKTHAWLPNQPTSGKPSVKFSYLIRNDGASVVTTTMLSPNKTEITSKTLYDGLLRPRQTQTPAMGGGRLIVDTRYDSLGRQWKTTQPYFQSGNIDDTVWLAQDTDIPGHTRTYYDDAGRPSASVYYGGAFEKWRTTTTYGGDRTYVTPPAGGTATTGITNARGELVEQRRYHGPKPEGSYDATFYTYTKAGQLETVTDPMSKVWRFTYDLRGRLVQHEDPDSGTSNRTFDDVNKLIKQKDARGITLAYAYDGLDRKIGVYAEEVTGKPLAEWTYDTAIKGVGKMASSTRWIGENAYTRKVLSYNPLYLPTESSVTIPASEGLLAGTYETFSSYNVDGSMSSESFDKAGQLPEESVSYKYDDLGALKESWGGYNGSTFHYGSATDYTRYGEVQRLRLGSGDKKVWQSFYYDSSTRRPTRSIVDAEVPSPMQSDTRYTFDPAGTITSIADVPLGQKADVQCFRHDQFRRLTQAWTADVRDWTQEEGCKAEPSFSETVSPASYWHTYTYDKSGNRETETKRAKIGTTNRKYTYDVPGHGHALKSVSTSGGGFNTTEQYEYNANGALLRKGSQEFTWDVENELTKVVTDGKDTTFVHDAEGNRLIRRDPEGTTLYLPGQELRLSVEGGNPKVTRYYSHGGNVIAVRQDNGSLSWLAGDHQGTGEITIDAGTLEVTRRRQLPFGEPRGEAVPWPTELGFVGGIKDKSTGLTHLGAREYDPALGRFISVDPVMNPADPQQINGYTYSNNNPITFSDPTGAFCDSCDYYHHNKGEESIWTPVPPNQETKPGAPTGYREAAVTSKIRKASANRKAKQEAAKPKAGCTELASSGYGMQPCKTASACPPGTVPGNGYLISGCVVPPHRGITSQEAHLILDICGTTEVPIGSQICDGLNAVIYLVEGEWVDAGISVGGMASGLGTAGTAARAADNAADLAKKGCSFTADTKVLMADGTTKPISEVKVGDEVMAADPQSGRVEPRQVTDVIVHLDFMQDLVLENGAKVTTTEDHPFWNESDRQWQRADAIGVGEKLLTATGQRSVFSGLRGDTRRVAVAHNLTVAGLHTFYVLVGDQPVLVHNMCPTARPKRTAERTAEVFWDDPDRGLEAAFMRHFDKHAKPLGKSEEQYLEDAADWAQRVTAPGGKRGLDQQLRHFDDGNGFLLRNQRTGEGGIIGPNGKVVSYWYRPEH